MCVQMFRSTSGAVKGLWFYEEKYIDTIVKCVERYTLAGRVLCWFCSHEPFAAWPAADLDHSLFAPETFAFIA